jgi:hypothetical protein
MFIICSHRIRCQWTRALQGCEKFLPDELLLTPQRSSASASRPEPCSFTGRSVAHGLRRPCRRRVSQGSRSIGCPPLDHDCRAETLAMCAAIRAQRPPRPFSLPPHAWRDRASWLSGAIADSRSDLVVRCTIVMRFLWPSWHRRIWPFSVSRSIIQAAKRLRPLAKRNRPDVNQRAFAVRRGRSPPLT